jgi:hypothetical protein
MVETQFHGQSKVEHSFDPSAVNLIVVHACNGDDVVTIQDQVDIDCHVYGDNYFSGLATIGIPVCLAK